MLAVLNILYCVQNMLIYLSALALQPWVCNKRCLSSQPVDLLIFQVAHKLGVLYSEMIFVNGYIHCDPHPGNILVRRNPHNGVEIVFLDHGLYQVCILLCCIGLDQNFQVWVLARVMVLCSRESHVSSQSASLHPRVQYKWDYLLLAS